ncbi:MAG: hypothetical protein JXO51_04005 [Candidatus Aminicenantes bacterium]|nr:hypothetical protein [Candidatus Aminicenantes bacterium]
MGIFRKKEGNIEPLIAERDRLLREIIPVLQEQVRSRPADGDLHLELVKALAVAGELEKAKAEIEAAMLKFPVPLRRAAWDLKVEIERLITNRRLEI